MTVPSLPLSALIRHFINGLRPLNENPLASALDKLVEEHRQVLQHETANVECEELGSMPSAKFETDLRLVLVSKARVFDLSGDLI